ncbi:MAG TPA: ion channel [Pyrinomonadaceae bacterium]|nr:ion channel [Pyrinomonadaceae bacterium]
MIHVLGLVLIADWLIDHSLKLKLRVTFWRSTVILISVFAILTVLHLVETFVWAAFYAWWGLFSDVESSWYFSLGSYTTIGYGDVVLPARWRILGGLEGISGVLLCGLSTAFLFAIVNQMLMSRLEQSRNSGGSVPSDAR